MQVYRTDLLVLGATAFAAGLCQRKDKELLVIDSGDQPAAEFTAALRSDGLEGAACRTAQGRALQQELQQRGILPAKAGAWPHLPAMQPVLAKAMLSSGVRFLFRTVVLSVQSAAGGLRVRVMTTGGLCEIAARRLLDTTAGGTVQPLLGRPRPEIAGLSLNAAIFSAEPVRPMKTGPFSVYPGVLEREGYLRFALPQGIPCTEAHEMLYHAWAERDAALAAYRIAYAAPVLDVLPGGERAADFIPSALFGNAVRAFDAGVQYKGEKEAAAE